MSPTPHSSPVGSVPLSVFGGRSELGRTAIYGTYRPAARLCRGILTLVVTATASLFHSMRCTSIDGTTSHQRTMPGLGVRQLLERHNLIHNLWRTSMNGTKRQQTHTSSIVSGTFLQTLTELVTSLKGHYLPPRSCPPTRSAPSERFGY